MAFENLGEKIQGIFKNLGKKGKIGKADIENAMREVKLSLLEADVNFKVVKQFVATVSDDAMGEKVMQSLNPVQMVIKIVSDELAKLLGEGLEQTTFDKLHIIMLMGLQGAGKTTTAAKLALNLRKKGKKPLLVACDIYRPAAIDQLKKLGGQLNLPVLSLENKNPVEIAENAVNYAKENELNVVILDTAGRLSLDDELMKELEDINARVQLSEKILVIDAMMGQESVNIAQSFNERVGIDGAILTKMDGDTRGGTALSFKSVVGKPIKYIGVGEGMDALENFYPKRMADRILGMGDVLTLIEKAEDAFNIEEAKKLEAKMLSNRMDLNDFLDQMDQMQKMGSLKDIMAMIPGVNKKQLGMIDEGKMVKTKAIIYSMTKAERSNPNIINGSRRERIANGSATKVSDVNALLAQFEQMKKMMKQLNNGGGKMNKNMLNNFFG